MMRISLTQLPIEMIYYYDLMPKTNVLYIYPQIKSDIVENNKKKTTLR